jgi:hypothetical protein
VYPKGTNQKSVTLAFVFALVRLRRMSAGARDELEPGRADGAGRRGREPRAARSVERTRDEGRAQVVFARPYAVAQSVYGVRYE